MESNQKKNVFLVGTICVLAVLAVTMMIGTKNQWWGNPYPPKKVNQGRICSDYLMVIHLIHLYITLPNYSICLYLGYEQVHHHEQVKVASPKCPKYQDMDGNCLGNNSQDPFFN